MTEIEARFILGLGPTFSADDLKRAYRKAAADNHPDRGGQPERMMLVNQAIEVLRFRPPSPSVESSPEQAPQPEHAPQPDLTAEHPPVHPYFEQFLTQTHPLDKFIHRVSAVLAFAMWACSLIYGDYPPQSDLDFWGTVIVTCAALSTIPICYFVALYVTRVLVSGGIHVYNMGIRIYDFVGSMR